MSIDSESFSDHARYTKLVGMLRPDYPFVQFSFHFGDKAEPTSRTMRVERDGKYFIKKEYLGQLNSKTEQEIGLLMAVAWKGLQHTASFKTVHARTRNLDEKNKYNSNEIGKPTLELLMKNYGLDLEDWFFLFRHGGAKFLDSPYFYLSIMHYILLAMKELHQANFVQVDVKSDNICVALPAINSARADAAPGSSQSDNSKQLPITFDLKTLTLIDLGEALHPDTNKRILLFHQNGMVLGPNNDYISRNYKNRKALVKQNDMKPLRSLDWRVDFYALGCMLDEWIISAQFSATPPNYLSAQEKLTYTKAVDFLRFMPMWLKAEDTDPATEPNDLPHDGLIRHIAKLVNLEKWSSIELCLPASIEHNASEIHISSTSRRIPPEQPARSAKETLLAAPSLTPLKSMINVGLTNRFDRTERIPPKNKVTKNDAQALNWYLKAVQKNGKLSSRIDLMC